MKPTAKLRFVERETELDPFYVTVGPDGKTKRATATYRVLQQWWEHTEWNAPGEWRDVPLENEK